MNTNLAIALINVTVIICFTILAVVFSKWWIVLFSFLCMFYKGEE